MRNIYVVTHPETTHHVNRLVGGWYDSELTLAGLRAATAIAKSLRARIPTSAQVELFSSDLQRTRQTAAAVSELFGIEPIFDTRLREKSYGEAEGRPQAWLDERFIPPPLVGERMDHDEGIPGAETKGAQARRVYAAMESILASSCENQIIVTHGGSLTFVIAAWLKIPLDAAGYVSFRGVSGSITVLCEDDFFHNRQLASLAETTHLP